MVVHEAMSMQEPTRGHSLWLRLTLGVFLYAP